MYKCNKDTLKKKCNLQYYNNSNNDNIKYLVY